MAKMFCLITAVIVSGPALYAQAKPIRGEAPPWPPVSGKTSFILTPAPRTQPQSLAQLCEMSSVVMDGFVLSTSVRQLPTHRLETDVVFQPTRILKGPIDTSPLVVTQRGGSVGEYSEEPTQYALMKLRERYLLFANDDTRPMIPQVTGKKRYLITGEWIGNFRFDPNNTVRLSSGAPDSLIALYDGKTQDQVLSAVAACLRQ